jgi:hypothetical protein
MPYIIAFDLLNTLGIITAAGFQLSSTTVVLYTAQLISVILAVVRVGHNNGKMLDVLD